MTDAKPCRNLGQLLLEGFRRNADKICQIDAATGESETYGSVLKRSISLVRYFRQLGMKPNDVIAYSGRNHLDLKIPYHAALMTGCPIVGIDPQYKCLEIKHLFSITKPKLCFCELSSLEDVTEASRALSLDVRVVTYDGTGDGSFQKILQEFSGSDEDFELEEFDPDTTFAWLLGTSGSTGLPKVAAYHHTPVLQTIMGFVKMYAKTDAGGLVLNLSPLQWMSSYLVSIVSSVLGQVCVQTSTYPAPVDHIVDIINQYKPTSMTISPVVISQIISSEKVCDLTCFSSIYLGGSKVGRDLAQELKRRGGPATRVVEMYGQTESLTPALEPSADAPPGSCGRPFPFSKIKLVDVDTLEEITEPNKPGELWVKGDKFAIYYNNPEETAASFTDDGWFRTGDVLYKDENNFFYYVERIKLMIKYAGHTIYPGVIEEVLNRHPGVLAAAVTSRRDAAGADLPVAVLVPRAGVHLPLHEIHELVAKNLSENVQLRGGIEIVEEIPLTSTGKIARTKLRDMVKNIYERREQNQNKDS